MTKDYYFDINQIPANNEINVNEDLTNPPTASMASIPTYSSDEEVPINENENNPIKVKA